MLTDEGVTGDNFLDFTFDELKAYGIKLGPNKDLGKIIKDANAPKENVCTLYK